jgi:hypothetical protein
MSAKVKETSTIRECIELDRDLSRSMRQAIAIEKSMMNQKKTSTFEVKNQECGAGERGEGGQSCNFIHARWHVKHIRGNKKN